MVRCLWWRIVASLCQFLLWCLAHHRLPEALFLALECEGLSRSVMSCCARWLPISLIAISVYFLFVQALASLWLASVQLESIVEEQSHDRDDLCDDVLGREHNCKAPGIFLGKLAKVLPVSQIVNVVPDSVDHAKAEHYQDSANLNKYYA